MAGSVGALAVFILGLVREWWRNEQERRGLLRLLLAEIDHNAEVVTTIGEGTWDLLSSSDFPSIQTATWHDTRVRAAHLLPEDLSKALNGYYSPLQNLLTLLTFRNRTNERTNREIRGKYAELTGKEVPGSRNPFNEYLEKMLLAQDDAKNQITAYLAITQGERLLLTIFDWLNRLRKH